MTDLLTQAERHAIDLTTQLVNHVASEVIGNEETRDHDLNEFVFHIHAIQRMIMSQAAGRAYPTEYRLLGGVVAGPGPTSEPTCEHGYAEVHIYPNDEPTPAIMRRCPGPTLEPAKCEHDQFDPHYVYTDGPLVCPGPTQPTTCPNCGHAEPHTSRRGECPICGCDADGPGPTDDERPATTREVGSGPTNPLPKGADDE